MKGYRTIIVNMLFGLATTGTVQFSSLPPEAQHWLTLVAMAWTFAALALRLVTNTPIGQQLEADVEKDLGITPEQMQELLAKLPQQADLASLLEQGEKILQALQKVPASGSGPEKPAPPAPPVPVPPAPAVAPSS